MRHFLYRWLTTYVITFINEQPIHKIIEYVVYVFYFEDLFLVMFEQYYPLFQVI